jgi:hypothetical protein
LYFGDNETYFYTNRIPDFDYGGKFFARLGETQVGALATRAPDQRTDIVLRMLQELGVADSASLTLVGSDREDFTNLLTLAQFKGRRPSGLFYQLDGAVTTTQNLPGDGSHTRGTLGQRWDYTTLAVDADRYSEDFLPANGLLKADLPGTRGVNAYASYYRDLAESPLRVVTADLVYTNRDVLDGRTQRRYWNGGGTAELRQQMRFGLFYTDGIYRPVSGGPGEFSDTVNNDHYWTASIDFPTRSSRYSAGVAYSDGSLGGDDYNYVSSYFIVRPLDRALVGVTSERLERFGIFRQTVVSGQWDVTSEDVLVSRFIDRDDFDFFRLGYGRRVRKGVDVFVVFDREPPSPNQLSLKLTFTL